MAEVLLKDFYAKNEDEDVKEVLVMEARHYEGKYRLSVTKENICYNHTRGWTSRQFLCFADGNFNVPLGLGRKSAKKLEKLEILINSMKDDLTDMWKNGEYQKLASTFCARVRAEGIM